MTERALLNMNGLKVAGMLVVLGAAAYAIVGGPLLIASGSAVALALIAYRRWQWRHDSDGPTPLFGVRGINGGQRQSPAASNPHSRLASSSVTM